MPQGGVVHVKGRDFRALESAVHLHALAAQFRRVESAVRTGALIIGSPTSKGGGPPMLDSGVRRNDGARRNDVTRRTARFALAAREYVLRGAASGCGAGGWE